MCDLVDGEIPLIMEEDSSVLSGREHLDRPPQIQTAVDVTVAGSHIYLERFVGPSRMLPSHPTNAIDARCHDPTGSPRLSTQPWPSLECPRKGLLRCILGQSPIST